MDTKKEAKKYLNKYFKAQHLKETDDEYKSLVRLLNKALRIHDVVGRFSGDNLMKLQKHFVSLYGSDEMAKEKANSFAVGFGKACELMIKELNAL